MDQLEKLTSRFLCEQDIPSFLLRYPAVQHKLKYNVILKRYKSKQDEPVS